MSKTLEGMNRAYCETEPRAGDIHVTMQDAMKSALLWLADNVSDEMAQALVSCKDERGWKPSIAAALRAAAGSAPTPPEVK